MLVHHRSLKALEELSNTLSLQTGADKTTRVIQLQVETFHIKLLTIQHMGKATVLRFISSACNADLQPLMDCTAKTTVQEINSACRELEQAISVLLVSANEKAVLANLTDCFLQEIKKEKHSFSLN